MTPIKVLIVDDSALIRQLLAEVLKQDPEISVVGTAPDPYVAWQKIKTLQPDVLTLDVEMPKMDGLTFLDKLMRARPMPVIMVSSSTEAGCRTTLRALELGALDFVAKPKVDVLSGTVNAGAELLEKIKAAAIAKVNCTARWRTSSSPPTPKPVIPREPAHKVLCIGASTGGTEALAAVLSELPADSPGVLIVQHMPPGFTRSFAERLDGICAIRVKEAEDGDRVLQGHALLAPGGMHMAVTRVGFAYTARIGNGQPVNRHRPSVDVLFRSAARHLGDKAIGVLLTGMGSDGAKGLLAMRQAGAHTIAEDESTCVVFGMPREAIAVGAAEEIIPLDKIANHISTVLHPMTPAPVAAKRGTSALQTLRPSRY